MIDVVAVDRLEFEFLNTKATNFRLFLVQVETKKMRQD